MKRVNKTVRCLALLVTCLVFAAAGCAKTGPKVESPKVPDAADVSTACAQRQGFDEEVSESLAKAIKTYDGKLSDEFKLRAMVIISESDTLTNPEKNVVLTEYFSCLQSSASE